jgi:hypothetical protein
VPASSTTAPVPSSDSSGRSKPTRSHAQPATTTADANPITVRRVRLSSSSSSPYTAASSRPPMGPPNNAYGLAGSRDRPARRTSTQ